MWYESQSLKSKVIKSRKNYVTGSLDIIMRYNLKIYLSLQYYLYEHKMVTFYALIKRRNYNTIILKYNIHVFKFS